jgi:hypothetical protein
MQTSSNFGGYKPDDLVTALSGESPRLAIFTTFTFSPSVFQQKYANPLLRYGCGNINVLTDPLGYSQSLSVAAFAEGIGTHYRLRSVAVAGAFHAKLALIRCNGCMLVGVGSGNLTASGLLTNAEVSGLYRIQHGDALRQLDNLVKRLSVMAGLCNADGDLCLPVDLTGDSRLILSLDDSIFDQVDFPAHVQRVELFSPFVDDQLAALTYISQRWPSAKIRLHLDPDFGALNDALIEFGGQVEVLVPQDNEKGQDKIRRPMVHGKLMCFIGSESSVVLNGSANLSRPAVLAKDNFEAVVERRMSNTDLQRLLEVPKVQWRKATKEDRKATRVFTPVQQVAALTAFASGRNVQVSWSEHFPAEAVLSLSRGGSPVFTGRIEAKALSGGTRTASVEIDESEKLDGPATAELKFQDGRIARGWIDIAERLGATPAMKRQFSLLDAIASDPENCKIEEVAEFILELMRSIQNGQRTTSASNSYGTGASAEELNDTPFLRSSTLVSGHVGNFDGDLLFEQLVRRKLGNAVSELTFFRSEEQSTGRKMAGAVDPELTKSESEAEPEATASLPPRISTVLSKLFRQLAEAIEVCDSASAVAFHVRQIPTCLEAMQFAVKRWSAELHTRDLLSQNFAKVIAACCAPGVRSIFQRAGSLTLIKEGERERLSSVEPFAAGIAKLEAGLLIDFQTDPESRQSLIRDMYDVLRVFRLPTASDLQLAGESMWRLAARGNVDPPDFSELRRRIELVQGDESAIVACRNALRILISEAAAGSNDSHKMDDLSVKASNGNQPQARALLTLIADAGRHARLVEIPLDEDACPECNTMFPVSVQNQLKAPTVVKRCGACGSLLVRSLE